MYQFFKEIICRLKKHSVIPVASSGCGITKMQCIRCNNFFAKHDELPKFQTENKLYLLDWDDDFENLFERAILDTFFSSPEIKPHERRNYVNTFSMANEDGV